MNKNGLEKCFPKWITPIKYKMLDMAEGIKEQEHNPHVFAKFKKK